MATNPFITAIDKANNRTTPGDGVITSNPQQPTNPFISAIAAVNTPQFKQEHQPVAAPVAEQVPTDQSWYQKIFSSLNRLKERASIGAQQGLASIQNTGGIAVNKFAKVEQSRIDNNPYAPQNKPVQDPQYNQLSKTLFGSENAVSQGLYNSTEAGKDANRIKGYKDTATNIKEAGNKTFIEAKQHEDKFVKENGQASGFQWFAEQVAQSTPSFLVNFGIGVAAGVVTKNPVLAMSLGFGTSFAQSTGQAYQDAKDFGLSDVKAEDVAIVSGSAQALIETLPIGKILSEAPAGKEIEKAVMKQVVKDVIEQGLVEGGTEGLQQLIDNAVKKTYNQNQELFQGVPEAFILGLGMGAGADVLFKGGETVFDKATNKSQIVDPEVIAKADENIKEALQTPANERTEFQQKIVDTLYTQELTPREIHNKVISDPEFANSEVGQKLLKYSLMAEEQGKIVQIKGSEDESKIDIKLIDAKSTQLPLQGIDPNTTNASSLNEAPVNPSSPVEAANNINEPQAQQTPVEQPIATDTTNLSPEQQSAIEVLKDPQKQANQETAPIDRTKLTDKQLETTNEQLTANKQKTAEGVILDNNVNSANENSTQINGENIKGNNISNSTNLGNIISENKVKPTPSSTLKGKPEAGAPKADQVPVGTGKPQESRAYKRVRDRLDEATQTDVNYNRLNLEQDAGNALNFISENPTDALKVAFGMQDAPKGQTETAIAIALADKAGREGKFRLQSQLESSRSLRQTRRGQEIVSERGRFNENSPYKFIQEVMDRRLKDLGHSSKEDIAAIVRKEGEAIAGKSVKEKAIAKIDAEAVKLKEKIKKDAVKIRSAQDLIDSLRC